MKQGDIGDCKQLLKDEIQLLNAMYDDKEFEISSPNFETNETSDVQAIARLNINGIDVEAVFQYSPLYPLSAWPTVFVRSNSLNSAEFNKQLRAYVEKLSLGEPQTVNIIQWIQENLISFTESSKNSSKGDILNLSATDAAVCYERLWIYSHHLFSSTKRRKIVTEAKLLHLRGFSVPGKPGIIVVEGISENCKTFWETIVKYGWKKIVIRWKETVSEENFLKFTHFKEIVLPSGDGKTINYSDLKKLLTDMDLGYGFEKLLNLS